MYLLLMNPVFLCCSQQFAVVLLAASASWDSGVGRGRDILFCFIIGQKILKVWFLGWREAESPCALLKQGSGSSSPADFI